MYSLSDAVGSAIRRRKDQVDSITNNNTFIKRMNLVEQSRIKGTPEYHEWVIQVVDHLDSQRKVLRDYLALPWWKRIFTKPEYIVFNYGHRDNNAK